MAEPRRDGTSPHCDVALVKKGSGFSFADWGHFGPTSVTQSPPYPFLLAGLFFKIFGTDAPAAYFTAMMLNAVAGAALVSLTYAMARTLGASTLAAMLAAAAVAVWPSQIYSARAAQAVAIISAALAASIILFYKGDAQRQNRDRGSPMRSSQPSRRLPNQSFFHRSF